MASSIDWSVEVFLGTELVVFGRIREHGHVVEGNGQRTRTYEELPWLVPFRSAAANAGATLQNREEQRSSRCPDRENGLLSDDEHGFFGGLEVDVSDFVIATWGAVGGASGVIAFLRMLKEIKTFWKGDRSVEVTLKDGTKVKLVDESGIEVAVAAITALEERAASRLEVVRQKTETTEQKRLRDTESTNEAPRSNSIEI